MLTYSLETEGSGVWIRPSQHYVWFQSPSCRVVGFWGPDGSDGTGAGPSPPSSILRSGKGPTLPHPCEPEVWIFYAATRMKRNVVTEYSGDARSSFQFDLISKRFRMRFWLKMITLCSRCGGGGSRRKDEEKQEYRKCTTTDDLICTVTREATDWPSMDDGQLTCSSSSSSSLGGRCSSGMGGVIFANRQELNQIFPV